MTIQVQGGLPGTVYLMSDSGWRQQTFENDLPKFFFLQMLTWGRSISLIELAWDTCVILHVLPHHTTHLLQPLDVGWVLQNCMVSKLQTLAARVDRQTFPSLLRKIWDWILLPKHLIGGFKGTRFHPMSWEAIQKSAPFSPLLFLLFKNFITTRISCI